MTGVRRDLLEQILVPRVTVADIACTLRHTLRHDPVKGEEAVGTLYGQVFRNKERRYDAAGGRWLPVEDPS